MVVQPNTPKNRKMINETTRELDYYLIQLFKPDPWSYAIQHCQSMSDVYSRVHWAHNPNGSIGDRVSGQIIKLSQQEFDEIFGEEKPIPKKDRILN
jgi:hypothetical protein